MENPAKQIQPLLKQSLFLRSLYTYKECLIRRPKRILNLDCAHFYTVIGQKSAHFKLLKAAKFLKPVKKVDLSAFKVRYPPNSKNVFSSILKSVSKVPAIKLERNGTYHELSTNTSSKWLKPLTNLRSLVCQFQWTRQPKDPLRYLRWCPKIESLNIVLDGSYQRVLKIFNFQKYPTSLKHLSLEGLLDRQEDQNFVIPFHRFKDLQSIYLRFDQTMCHNLVIRNLEALSSLSNLQEVILNLEGNLFPAIHPILRKLSQRKVFKKFALICIGHCPDEEALQILQDFDQLTHFKISAHVEGSLEVRRITQSIQNMKNLEYLNVQITNRFNTNAGYELQIMLQNIDHFDSLRFLKLSLHDNLNLFTLPSFVPHLRHILTKAIPLESLSIWCDRLNPTQTLADLADVFQDCSHPLQKLDLYFGRIYSPEKKAQESIIRLLQSLKDLQVFSFYGHVINSTSYFAKMAAALRRLRYVRELNLGKLNAEAIKNPSVFEYLIRKRGLSFFTCEVPHSVIYDLWEIAKRNPFLEYCQLSRDDDGYEGLQEMYLWYRLPADKPDPLFGENESDFRSLSFRSPGLRSPDSRSPGLRSQRSRSDDLSEDDQSDYRTLENQSPHPFGESPSDHPSPRYRSNDQSGADQHNYNTFENQSPRLFGESPSDHPSQEYLPSPGYRSDGQSRDDQHNYNTFENQSPRLFGESPSGYYSD